MRPAADVRQPAHVPLARRLRDGFIEGVHYGSVVVVAPDGSILFAAGDPHVAMLPRSGAKPVQVVAMTMLGLELPPDLLALAAGSHSGERAHQLGTQRILVAAECTEQDLQNPASLPLDRFQRQEWIAIGRQPSRLAHTCSGQHAAMLATVRDRGWSTSDYPDPEHPLQAGITAQYERLCGERVAGTLTDGCGVPLLAVSLTGLTRAIGRIAAASEPTSPNHQVATAMTKHPDMVAGSNRDVTALMRAVPGLLAKDGFEAVQVAALPDGTAVGVKIADGSDRARMPVTAAALALCGVDRDTLEPFREEHEFLVVGPLAIHAELAV